MPPVSVKNVRDLIFYQYAKIIAASAGISGYKFIMNRMQLLSSGKITMSNSLREIKFQMSCDKCCGYCQTKENLSWDHLIPRLKGGPDMVYGHAVHATRQKEVKVYMNGMG